MNKDKVIYAKFAQLGRLFQRYLVNNFKKKHSFIDPSRGQGRIIRALQIKEGISTKDLAYILGIQVCSLNELLQKLERNGYIYREPSSKDKRVYLIYLTEKGKKTNFEEHSMPEEMLEGFTEEEKEQLIKFLDKIIENLKSEESDEGFGPFGNGFGPFNSDFSKTFFDKFRDFNGFPGFN